MRNSLALMSALVLMGGAAHAQQQTIDESLTQVRIFDCALNGNQALYVFRTSEDGAISLVGDDAAPVRATQKGLTIMTADGVVEISDGAYHTYGAGNAESGTCTEITEFAHVLYPAMTLAYTPSAEGGTVAEQAAAASLADLTVRTQRAEAETAAAQSKRDAMQAELEARSNDLAAATAEKDDLSARLAAAISELAALNEAMAALTEDRDGLAATLSETQASLEETEAALEVAMADLEKMRTLQASASAAATDFQGQLGATAEKLALAEADNRTLVATVAGLNSKISDLGATLRSTRAERDAAQQKASSAGTTTVASSSLTNAAIARIASLQGRSTNAVRSELCRILGRGGGC